MAMAIRASRLDARRPKLRKEDNRIPFVPEAFLGDNRVEIQTGAT